MEALWDRGASEFRTASVEMDNSFVGCPEEVRFQRRLAALLAAWRRDKAVPTIPEAAFSCLDEDWILLWLVVKRWYWAREHRFETLNLNVLHLAGWLG